jgi:hypothetical protein
VPKSIMHDVPLLRPFLASVNTVKDTTEELHSITIQYNVSNKVAQLYTAPSSSREVSPDVVI